MEIGNFWTALASYRWVIFWLIVLWYFRYTFIVILTSLANLCNRIKSTTFEFIGIKLGADTSIALGGEGINDEKFNALLKAFQSPIVTNEERIIKNQLIEAKCSDAQAVAVLVSQLANRNIFTLLCLIDRLIYDEQINLLLYLNTNNKTCSGDDLERFYTNWREKNAKIRDALADVDQRAANVASSTYEQFLGFLITHGLISQNMNGYRVTQLGKDYLSFIVKAGRQLPENEVYSNEIAPTLDQDRSNQVDSNQ